jgi:hypothetical protein
MSAYFGELLIWLRKAYDTLTSSTDLNSGSDRAKNDIGTAFHISTYSLSCDVRSIKRRHLHQANSPQILECCCALLLSNPGSHFVVDRETWMNPSLYRLSFVLSKHTYSLQYSTSVHHLLAFYFVCQHREQDMVVIAG